jgi:hypothetical protein
VTKEGKSLLKDKKKHALSFKNQKNRQNFVSFILFRESFLKNIDFFIIMCLTFEVVFFFIYNFVFIFYIDKLCC